MIASSRYQNVSLIIKLDSPELRRPIQDLVETFPLQPSSLVGKEIYEAISNKTGLPDALLQLLCSLIFLYEAERGSVFAGKVFLEKSHQLALVKASGLYAERLSAREERDYALYHHF